MLTRRDLLRLGLLAGPSLVAFGKISDSNSSNLSKTSSSASAFQVELPRPAVLTPMTAAEVQAQTPAGFTPVPGTSLAPPAIDADFYLIIQKKGQRQILPTGPQTTFWGYNGLYPGPTIVASKDRPVVVRQVNALNEANTSTTHLHGAHTLGTSDGGAFTDHIDEPGQFRDYVYPNSQPGACTLFYHDHLIDFTGRNLFMGLAAFYVVQDDLEQDLVRRGLLPGPPFDIAMAFQDRQFDANNQLLYNSFDHDGFLGNRFLVNGAIQPKLTVANRRYRFRWLNGANARFYAFALSTGEPFTVIGSEQSLLPHPVQVNQLTMGLAERYEVIVDFSKHKIGDQVYLLNIMQQTEGRGPDGIDLQSAVPVLRFDVAIDNPEQDPQPIPDPLATNLVFPQLKDVVATRSWEFQRSDGAWQINGEFFDENRISAQPRMGTTERWIFKNGGGGWFHPIHPHAEAFRMLSRNGKPPQPWELGLKDTSFLAGGDEVQVLISYATKDIGGKYNMHCHNTEHEDMRMMIRFDVVS